MIGGHIIAICRGVTLVGSDGEMRAIPHVCVTARENQGVGCTAILLHPTNYGIRIGAPIWWQGDTAFVTMGGREVRIPRLRVTWDGEVVTPGT